MAKLNINSDRLHNAIANRQPFETTTGGMTGVYGLVHRSTSQLPSAWQVEYFEDHREHDIGYTVLSYDTPIAWVRGDGKVVVPREKSGRAKGQPLKYSRTTSKHQRIACMALGVPFIPGRQSGESDVRAWLPVTDPRHVLRPEDMHVIVADNARPVRSGVTEQLTGGRRLIDEDMWLTRERLAAAANVVDPEPAQHVTPDRTTVDYLGRHHSDSADGTTMQGFTGPWVAAPPRQVDLKKRHQGGARHGDSILYSDEYLRAKGLDLRSHWACSDWAHEDNQRIGWDPANFRDARAVIPAR